MSPRQPYTLQTSTDPNTVQSTILCVTLLMLSQGIVDKIAFFINNNNNNNADNF